MGSTVDDDLEALPEDRRKVITAIRKLIRKNVPKGYALAKLIAATPPEAMIALYEAAKESGNQESESKKRKANSPNRTQCPVRRIRRQAQASERRQLGGRSAACQAAKTPAGCRRTGRLAAGAPSVLEL
jgi:hypothetical protein